MYVLVLNCGSSSIKAAVVDPVTGDRVVDVSVTRLGEPHAFLSIDGGPGEFCPGESHEEALAHLLPRLRQKLQGKAIDAVGHRVVHGGEKFVAPVLVDDEVEAAIDALAPLAPLHNPENLAGIRAARDLLPAIPHVAVFDTAFHATLPRRARTYAIDADVAAQNGLRRFGFHGTSHAWVASRVAEHTREDARHLRIVSCHLGNGASLCAIEGGRSVETSMGMTPLEGLVMGTRSGDLDPGMVLALLRDGTFDVDGLDRLLNRHSGLSGLSGVSNDLREIEKRASEGDDRCRLAIAVFAHRVRKYLGAYAAVMGGVDVIAFTGGIGENSVAMRHRIVQRFDFLGARLDEERNRDAKVDRKNVPVATISDEGSRVRVVVVACDEEREIAREAFALIGGKSAVAEKSAIPIAISNRHVHLDRAACDALFGPGSALHPEKDLSQPGEFAAWERVTLVGPKSTIEGVRVVGPLRSRTQVEISRTDEFELGVDAPIRMSGDLDNTPGITLRGPNGDHVLTSGVICSQRHIHMAPSDADRFGVKHQDIVEVEIDSEGRDLVFRDVIVRVKPTFKLEMHIDTDEGNAAELARGTTAVLQATTGSATVRTRDPRFDSLG